jgi:hypothetical protein
MSIFLLRDILVNIFVLTSFFRASLYRMPFF